MKLAALLAILLLAVTRPTAAAQTYIEMPLNDYIESLRAAAGVIRAEAGRQDHLATLSPSPLPSCRGPGRGLAGLLGEIAGYMEEAAEAASKGDWSAFREAKSRAYLLVSCYPGLAYFAGEAYGLVYLLVSAEPSGSSVLVPVAAALGPLRGVQQPGGPPEPLPPTPPMALPPIEPPAMDAGPGGGWGGMSPGEPSSSVEIGGGAAGDIGVDVSRLLDMLARAREAIEEAGSTGGQEEPQLMPSLPSSRIPLVALAAAALYAARGVVGAAASSAARLAGILYSLARYRRLEIPARECYRKALGSVESETGRRKNLWETPREYLHAVRGLLGAGGRAWFEDKTKAYELEVYGGRPRVFRVEECVRGGRLAGWRLAGKR